MEVQREQVLRLMDTLSAASLLNGVIRVQSTTTQQRCEDGSSSNIWKR